MIKLESLFEDYQKAFQRLKEALREEKTDIIRDSAIKRYEFTFDICWKLVKAFLEEEKGLVCRSPKDCFRMAFQQKVIEFDNTWISMVDWRNEVAHIYKESLAEELYNKLPRALEKFEELEKTLRTKSE